MSVFSFAANRAADQKVLRLAWPCILENLAVIMISFIDAAMIGVLGPAATAAVPRAARQILADVFIIFSNRQSSLPRASRPLAFSTFFALIFLTSRVNTTALRE